MAFLGASKLGGKERSKRGDMKWHTLTKWIRKHY
jgi:hypothetical protein